MRRSTARYVLLPAVAMMSMLAVVSVGTRPAAAAPVTTTLVADPLSTWQVSGKVWALASANGVVYVGGTFSSVRPPGAAAGTGEVPRANFAAFDAATGNLLACAPSFTVQAGVTPSIQALKVSPDGSTLYIGGRFSSVGAASAGNFAALKTANCTLRSGSPRFSGLVGAFAPSADTVYVGGSFTKVNNQPRERLAAITPTGALLAWAPSADATVQALTLAPDLSRVYAGGDFKTVDGDAIQGLVALDPTTGAVAQSFPGWITGRDAVKALSHDNRYFYVAAEGTGAGQFDGRIAADVYTGALHWRDTCTGATQDLLPHNGVVYSASHAHDCSHVTGGFPNYAMDGRQHLLAETIGNDTILPWFPDTNEGPGNVGVGPEALTMSGSDLWVGGEFTTVNKQPQQGLTHFPPSPDTGSPAKTTPTGSSPTAGVAKISWPASWDRDDGVLTYSLYRDGGTTPIYTTHVDSRYWLRPTMVHDDTGLVSGSTHSYRITVSDGINTSPRSTAATVTIS